MKKKFCGKGESDGPGFADGSGTGDGCGWSDGNGICSSQRLGDTYSRDKWDTRGVGAGRGHEDGGGGGHACGNGAVEFGHIPQDDDVNMIMPYF